MTRSVTIVNTSNWDGEDYLVRKAPGGSWWRQNKAIPDSVVTLKPGESISLCPEVTDFEIRPTNSKKPEPFRLNGDQVFPVVLSYVGQIPKKM